MRLILASGSTERQEIFNMVGFKYEVIKSLVEEDSKETDPSEYVKELSKNKANSVASQIEGQAVIVAADTVIYMNGKVYEKPKTKEEAFQNIKEMSGNVTYAITGVTIKDLYQDKEICFADIGEVYIKDVCDEDIKWYVENEKAIFERAGYAIHGKAAIFLDKINGDYNTLFGISPSKVYDKLKELGYNMADLT